ncbi:hypothetical protein BCU19_14880 [Vibrio cyclitrophicus]|uniref:hypothetical protein n=1 Tax=Vibrio TaxID=662 RepID=UPI0006315939|nr:MULTISPECIES: hypothetical protein [Vibrio]PMJ51422.1 hypothetical protein BCU19_05865 [Vibrio cyclitrophicus]CDT52383.1 conserved hypothetical protein [Vibrio coralliirubri]
MKLPELELFNIKGSPFLVVDPSVLPAEVMAKLDEFMIGKTVSHAVFIYEQDWNEFCHAVERGDIK